MATFTIIVGVFSVVSSIGTVIQVWLILKRGNQLPVSSQAETAQRGENNDSNDEAAA